MKTIGHKIKLPPLDSERAKEAKVLAFMNNKGGCGKTSTSIAEGVYLARSGKNVLFIDCDSQCNLSQRMGISDDLFQDRRLTECFNLMENEDFLEQQMHLPISIHFKYLYKLQGFDGKHGTIALLPGSQFAEDVAALTIKKLSGSLTLAYEQRQIGKRFKAAIRKFLEYFDYVILDTAPALEGSLLCQLALQASDEIICPVDGLEAALGLQHVIDWLNMQSSPSYGILEKPNLTLALTKYHEDDIEELISMTEGHPIKNAVFSALKDVLGQYVCDNGIREDKSKKNKVYQVYGRINDYEDLCGEIARKISQPRPNFFENWNINSANRLRAKLRIIEAVTLKKKTPVFKDIMYQGKKGKKILELDNVDVGTRH
ncbi:hypothetical protein EO95_09450 [Methanosarcina sp. 1.H.T.1A.1]|uniref:ParA family protein n=1 Tax=Methanosarcina sp. 1.H.T.1A.1 TaxID=1483602 RepID=UPI000620FB94|nr:AAA family ATPase [Methanosarcina sp. 1.H.T.1A.1]KKH92893.1 hypothetical protein EO95_09450 [Methanosarcina sp. 1.H.T.1A.1]